MRTKKLLAVILSLALLISVMPIAGLGLDIFASETTATVYVDDTGSDATANGTKSAPYGTINAAIAALNGMTATTKVVKIVTSATLPDTMQASNDLITITGEDSSAVLNMTSNVTLGGDVIFGGLSLNNTAIGSNYKFYAANHAVTFNADIKWTDYPKMADVHMANTNANSGKSALTINGMRLYRVFTGGYYNTKNVTAAGADVNINGGQIYALFVGANGWSGAPGTTTYTGNVNIVMNGGTINTNKIQVMNVAAQNRFVTFADGAALQVIFNNGKGSNILVEDNGNTGVEYSATHYYRLNCAAKSGSTLSVTDKAGTYKVNGELMAVATSASGKVYKSAGGYLTVPAGVYDVAWAESTEPAYVYVDQTNGSDNNNGELTAPFATINAAITALKGVSNPNGKVVRIIGTYNLTEALSMTAHTEMITIEGAPNTNATFNVGKHVTTIGGPLTLDNIALTGDYTFRARTYKLVFGEGVTYNKNTSKDKFASIVTGATYGSHLTTAGPKEELTINGGGFSNIILGNEAVTANKLSPSAGIDFVMNGGYAYKIYVGTSGWDAWPGGTSYEGNVNLTINGGQFGYPEHTNASGRGGIIINKSNVVKASNFNGNAVQVLFNNETWTQFTAEMFPSAATVTEQNGKLYMLKCDSGVFMETTADAGVYKIAKGESVIATNVETGATTTSVNGTLTLTVPGTYTVSEYEQTSDGVIEIDKGDTDAVFTNTAGTINITAPNGKLPYAVTEDGKTVYVAGDYTTIGSAKTPATNYQNTTYTDWGCIDNNGSYLVNTYNKLAKDKKLNVVYFGGSLTAGFGCGEAGDPNGLKENGISRDYSWRGLSGTWLQKNFPNATINLTNCAIGESGTYLGTFRVQDDIIPAAPDLLFIEYAINDCYHGSNKATAKLQLETIVREVKAALPTCDIVIVLTTDKTYMSTSYAGQLFPQADGHNEIAEAYGLPVINIGVGLAKGIAVKEGNSAWWNDSTIWNKYFYDKVHPFSTGHEQYFLCVEEFLENNLLYTDYSGMRAIAPYYPGVQSDYLFDGDRATLYGAAMQSAVDMTASTGTTYSASELSGLGSSNAAKSGYYTVSSSGKITIKFTGTELALWTKIDSGATYTYSVDGGAEKTMALSEHSPTVFATGLASATHTLTLSADKTLYIVGIFYRDAAKQTLKGAAFTYDDGRVPMTMTLPAGKYTLGYAATVGELPTPANEGDDAFSGWKNASNAMVEANAALTKGMVLRATFGQAAPQSIVYLDAVNGSDSNNGTSAQTAFATLQAAIDQINAASGTTGTVHLIGTYTLPSTLPTSEKTITIIGHSDTPSLTLTGTVTLGSHLILKDLAFTAENKSFVTGNYKLHLDNISNNYNTRVNATLGKQNASVGHQDFYWNGGYLYALKVGSYYNTGSKKTVAGADVIINGGNLYRIYIGADNYATNGTNNYYGAKFTAPVNITINNLASINAINLYGSATYPNTYNEFVALQFIYNNGTSSKVSTLPHDAAIAQAGADKYWSLSCANQPGSTLEATETAGTFKVNGDLMAVATDASGKSYESRGGVLSVPAGIYTVTWALDATPLEVYVDATNGDDGNNGLTTGTAVKTLNAAIALIESSKQASGIVTILGTVSDPDNMTAHSKMVTFRGQNPATDGILNVNGVRLSGPTTFENIKLTNGGVRADGFELIIGEGVTTSQYPYVNFYSGNYNGNNTTRRDTVTVKSGSYNRGYLGPFYCTGGDRYTLGVDYLQTGGTVTYLTLGGDAWSAASPTFYGTIYRGDVNIAINGGQVGEIVVLKPVNDSNGNLVNRKTVFEGAVQVLINGEGYMTNALPNINAANGVWLMKGRNSKGYALETTDVAGTFKVNANNVYAIAYDEVGNVYQSVDGVLTVPVGAYTVTYTTELSYVNSGSTVKFFADASVNFASLAHKEIEGKMFVGWVDAQGNAPTTNHFAAGDVLTAKYVAYSEDDFAFVGSSIRFSNDNTKKDLRYIFQINDVLKKNALISNVKYGAVAIPNCMLTVNSSDFANKSSGDVKIGGVYRYNGKNYNVAQVEAQNTWKNTEGGVQYTLCLTGIASVKQDTRYAVRGYMTYTDMNGVEQVLYSEEASESLVSTAKRVLSDIGLESDDSAAFATIIANARAALQAKYSYDGASKVAINVTSAPAGSSAANGIVKRTDGSTAMTFYKLAGSGLIVRDVVIDGVGDTYDEEVNVVQITDSHLHAYNDEDIADGNPTVLASKIYRTHNNLNNSFDYGQKAIVNLVNSMEYASAYGDQTMLTGDIIDALTLGSLDLFQRHVVIAYPETINMLGNHEPVRQWQHSVTDASSLDSRYAIMQQNWNHDVYYTSRVLKNKVMVIQLDTSQEKFWASQKAPLEADLATARANGYTVLIYTHCMLSTLNSADTAVVQLYGTDEGAYNLYNKGVGKSDSTGVMNLIVNNADIIKGVFNGHMHADYYTEIQAKNADGTVAVIPQYTLHGDFYENGNVLNVTVR